MSLDFCLLHLSECLFTPLQLFSSKTSTAPQFSECSKAQVLLNSCLVDCNGDFSLQNIILTSYMCVYPAGIGGKHLIWQCLEGLYEAFQSELVHI